ncbi:SGNH/GDSL hydrolase family protein [Haloarcula amylovorans]|uniref:SGNH/GDSL hydrolase family protein n=1 Tax=Haloarcula amylovorans TaxID=2562280 RepID=UPI001075E6FB|nr:SGNH/GDSL hydrolase family protein [Halomicroarcula amylolytica]
MNETLLIQGDSLPLPRQTVPYEETWPGHLRNDARFAHIVNRSQSGKTTDDLRAEKVRFPGRKLELYSPDYVVLQIGIVDCAPRLLSKNEKSLLTSVPFEFVSRASSYAIKQLRDRSRQRTYVSKTEFEANLRDYLERAEDVDVDQLVVLKILTAGEKYIEKNPNVQQAITEYNRILDAVAAEFDFVETLRPLADTDDEEAAIVDEYTLGDGYHLNGPGHGCVYERLINESALGDQVTTTDSDTASDPSVADD